MSKPAEEQSEKFNWSSLNETDSVDWAVKLQIKQNAQLSQMSLYM